MTHDVQATENCYKIQKPHTFLLPRNEQVTFTTPDPVNLPLPSPHLLALHATCAQVANLSGAKKYLDSVFQDMEEMDVLAEDGSSTEVLHHALMTVGSAGV